MGSVPERTAAEIVASGKGGCFRKMLRRLADAAEGRCDDARFAATIECAARFADSGETDDLFRLGTMVAFLEARGPDVRFWDARAEAPPSRAPEISEEGMRLLKIRDLGPADAGLLLWLIGRRQFAAAFRLARDAVSRNLASSDDVFRVAEWALRDESGHFQKLRRAWGIVRGLRTKAFAPLAAAAVVPSRARDPWTAFERSAIDEAPREGTRAMAMGGAPRQPGRDVVVVSRPAPDVRKAALSLALRPSRVHPA